MAKKKTSKKKSVTEDFKEDTKKDGQPQEQLDLIDFRPENVAEIAKEARKYRQFVRARLAAGKKESAQKIKLLGMVMESKPTRLTDGSIKFVIDGLTVKVTPRDELIQVQESENE